MPNKKLKVPMFSLARTHRKLNGDIMKGINRVLHSGIHIKGPEVSTFEEQFAGWLGVKHAIGAACGFDSLELALLAAGIERDDEVITAANGCPATPMAITAVGAKPVFVDCDDSFNIDPTLIESAVTKKSRAIMVVHLYGRPADMDSIMKIARKNKLRVIEDCAQAHGSEWRGKKAGSFGDLGCFSFYPTKNLGAIGDAGAVVTNDDAFAHKVRMIASYGETARFNSAIQGINSRLDPLQAAVLKVKLEQLDEHITRRREIARRYITGLDGLDLVLPIEKKNEKHAYHLFVVRVQNRDRLAKELAIAGVGCDVHYPIPFHKLGAFKRFASGKKGFPKAELFAKTILSLPMFPDLTDRQVDFVIATIAKSLKK